MSSTEEEAPVLEDMTKTELQDHADSLGVDYSDSDTKAELIDAIKAADETPEEDGADEEETAPEAQASYDSAAFPERRAIEPDLADVDPGDGEGEHMPPFTAETWVVLDGEHDDVPDEYDGYLAAVISSPVLTVVDQDTGEVHEEFPPEGRVTVRERSQGVLLHLPPEAFKEVHQGRPAALGFA